VFLLTGEYELTVDSKNRLSIPSKVRDQLSGEEVGNFYLVLGVNRVLSLYPEKYYQRIALAVAPRKVAPDESLAFDRVNFALAGRVELDRQGRVLLNEKAMRRSKLGTEVTMIGAGDHLEIWNRAQWEEYLERNLDMHERMLLEAREERLQLQRELAKEVIQKQESV
jgi:MraZ protein